MLDLINKLKLNPIQRATVGAIQGQIAQGVSGNSILNALKGTHAAMRRQTFYKLYSGLKNIVSKQNYIKNVRYDYNLNPDRIPTGSNQYKKPYNYIIEYTGIDNATGEMMKQQVTVTSNSLITKADAEKIGTAAINWDNNYGMYLVGRGKVSDIYKGSFDFGE